MATIRFIQYLRPDRKEAYVYADIPDELQDLASSLIISCEYVSAEHAMIYAHRKGESEEDELTELADNGPGDNSPDIALERLIRRFEEKPFKPFLDNQ